MKRSVKRKLEGGGSGTKKAKYRKTKSRTKKVRRPKSKKCSPLSGCVKKGYKKSQRKSRKISRRMG